MRESAAKSARSEALSSTALVSLVQEILCGLPDATLWIGTTGRIETLNHAAEQMFGYGEEEIIGQAVSRLLAEPFYGTEVETLTRYFEQAERLPGKKREILGRRKGGQVFPLEVGLRAMKLQGHSFYCASVRDLTETLVREDERIQSQKLEAIGRLTSGVAHDFNNLLMGIMGCAHIALARIEEGSPAHRFVYEIIEAAKRGAALPAQLLAFGQKRDAELKRIDVGTVFEAMSEIFVRTLGEHIHFVRTISDEPPGVYMGVGQLEQVLMNLVLNARDAMPRGGKLELRAKRKYIDSELGVQLQLEAGDYACLEVCDTGCGIEEGNRTRVFEPYFTTKNGGRGLGLSAVYGLVRGAGGHISALPHAPQGTCIRLLLPMRQTPQDFVSGDDAPSAVPVKRQRILVAEDAELVRMAIVNSLEQAGYDVLEAEDGQEALELGEKTSTIDLLLTDLVLPRRNGVDLARALKRIHPGLRTILITAYARIDVRSRLRGHEEEFPIILQKPFDDTELLSALGHIRGLTPLHESKRIFVTQSWSKTASSVGSSARTTKSKKPKGVPAEPRAQAQGS